MALDAFIVPAVSAGLGAAASWVVPKLLARSTVGTRYRTQRECDKCETRRAVASILRMTRELAIKAGVPVHEALRVGEELEIKTEGKP